MRNYTEEGIIKIVFIKGSDNYADGFTKSVSKSVMDKNFEYMASTGEFSDV